MQKLSHEVGYHTKLQWFNSTVTNGKFTEGHDARMAKKRTNDRFLPKIMAYLQYLYTLSTSPQCLDLDSRRSGPRPKRDFWVTRPRFRKTCLETSTSAADQSITILKSFLMLNVVRQS